ncbi:MAG TPA: glutamate racemase [Lacibacter sp.]|nr:glutamate racemase [Lacibacter sp.]HMO88583.1 glutamate racemase [Lacibacter sp.]HMP86117.1 glutamate racemase [Lacibacter sp.]
MQNGPIGIFDSGYGGLTVLKAITEHLPAYDYLYLGDNARSPYGTRSYETVYRYTLECVRWFFQQGCPLVILACNTASAKALRTIQQQDLPRLAPTNRVLGVIRPTTEVMGSFSRSGHIGILATAGTVESGSYVIELKKFFPQLTVHQQACPMWVPLIENNEHRSEGAAYFIQKDVQALLQQDARIDNILLGCTHYPLVEERIRGFLPPGIQLVSQGSIVAHSLAGYLQRHPEMESRLLRKGRRRFCTTDSTADFDRHATLFYGEPLCSEQVDPSPGH